MKTKNGTGLCRCNNCDRILIDENPQVDAQKIEVKNQKVHSMEWVEDGEDGFWACPHCKTDAYLTDFSEHKKLKTEIK